MRIVSMGLTRFPRMLGHAQLKLGKALLAHGVKEPPKKGLLSSRGVGRKHVLTDMLWKGFVIPKVNFKEGVIDFIPTARLRKVLAAKVKEAKRPPTGYRKVRRGRPAKALNGKHKYKRAA